ncbi:MAG TPA: DUF58 domain-containing protein [Pirellulaceae bacterium]|nr:DUF58 domain-containing protein [Pirellulaceae bacterium]
MARVQNMSLAARGVVEGFITGLHASPYRGYSVEFAEHRNYVAGDNLRHLDWRMMARTDRLYVKQYEEETNLRAQIMLDTSGSMLYRASPQKLTKLEYGAYLVAMLGYLMTRQQDAVALTTFDDQPRVDMPPRSTARGFGEMIRQLEQICDSLKAFHAKRHGHPTQIASTLHRLAERFKRRCLVILVSDLYDDPEAVLKALHHFRHRKHELIVFHLFDESELEFPFKEPMQAVDMESGEKIQIDPSFVRDEYKRQIDDFVNTYRRRCTECQIDYVLAHTGMPYDLMLSRYLSRRSS